MINTIISIVMSFFKFIMMWCVVFFSTIQLIDVARLCAVLQPILQNGTIIMVPRGCQTGHKIASVLLMVNILYWLLRILLRMYRDVRWFCGGVLSMFYPHQD